MRASTFSLLSAAALATAAPLPKKDLASQLMGLLSWKPKLLFDSNGHFKIVNFSDMHFGERWGNGSFASWGPQNDAGTQSNHRTILDNEQPNFVVFNGDIMTGENVFADNATGYIDECFLPTVERNIPFSSTYGNHDNANNINHEIEFNYETEHYSDLSYTRADVGPRPYGLANYWNPVYENEWDWVPKLIIWGLDSRFFVSGTGDGPGPVPNDANYYWVDENTVPLYIQEQTELMRIVWGQVPPSIVFVHVPFKELWNVDDTYSWGDHDDEPQPSVQGFLNNDYTGQDQPTWNALYNSLGGAEGKLMAIVSGHDHGENYCGRGPGSSWIPVCMGGHSGDGGYVTPHSEVRNGRTFDFTVEGLAQSFPTVDTWASFANSTSLYHVTLEQNYLA